MKLLSYAIEGRDTFGLVEGDGVIDLGRRVASPTLRALIADEPDAIAAHAGERPDHDIGAITFRPPIPDPGMIICLGLNTHSHLVEARAMNPDARAPAKPWTFMRSPRSITGHNQNLLRPNGSPLFDYEGEIALVIGKHARHVTRENALDHVFGYSCFNEGSIRDYQLHSPLYTSGKNFPRTGSFGPWIVTADEVTDVTDLRVTTRLNGAVLQEMGYDDLIFGFADILCYVTSFTELHPGDVIVTGTAAGVGAFRQPNVWLTPGDICEVEVKGIGVLRNTVADAQGRDRGPVTRDDPEAAAAEARAALAR